MNPFNLRAPRIATVQAIALAVLTMPVPWAWLASPGTDTATRDRAVQALQLTASEQAHLEALAEWIEQAPANLEGGVVQAVRERNEAFELFRELSGENEVLAVLEDIPFGGEIAEAAATHGLDPLLVAAVVEVESTFRPRAGSHKGAVGLMQLLPSTAGMPAFLLFDPETNLNAGSAYLSEMLERFEGDLELALAAYNAGPTNVRRFGGTPPFRETQNYVDKVLSLYVGHHQAAWHRSGLADLVPLARQA